MINKEFDNLIEQLKAVRMSQREKSEILERTFSVIEKIEAVSIPISPEISPFAVARPVPTKSPFFSVWQNYIGRRKFVPALALVAVLLFTGGASLFAEGALPGDSLYSLKININEGLQGLTAITPEAKARLAVVVTEKRLQEAATLSARGELTDQSKAILQKEFQKRADQVKNQVASLVASNNLSAAQEIATNYESSLKAQETILEKISTDKTDGQLDHLNSIINTLKTEIATTTVAQSDLQTKEIKSDGNNLLKVQSKLRGIRAQISDTMLLQSTDESLSSSTKSLVAIKVEFAQVATVMAEGYISSGAYSDALGILQRASQALSDAQGAIKAEADLGSDVKSAIGINADGSSSRAIATTTASTTLSIPISTASSTATTSASVGGSNTATTTPSI